MTLRLAVVVSHPIQHFAPWHREVARLPDVDLRVFFCCDWGLREYFDPQFQVNLKWDIPLLEGYDHEFLPIESRPKRLGFWEVDNPSVGTALARFRPHVVQVFGYARRTNWRVVSWARRNAASVLLYSDSNAKSEVVWWRRAAKSVIVRWFYGHVDGALYCGDNNRLYHMNYGLPSERLFPGGLPVDRARLLKSVPDRALMRSAVRERHGIPPDSFVVMSCGKYASHKRPIDLAQAVGTLGRKGAPVWALLVGEGPERERIEAYCQSTGTRNVTLTGFVNQQAIGEYYAASDALAVTSEIDAHPLTVTEASSFGLPILVSDRVGCIGTQDTARPDENAIVYPCGDSERLASAVDLLRNDRNRYSRMSDASIAISETQDVTVLAKGLADVSRRLHEMGPRRRRGKIARG